MTKKHHMLFSDVDTFQSNLLQKKEEDKIWSVLNKTTMILNKRKDNQLVRNKEVQT